MNSSWQSIRFNRRVMAYAAAAMYGAAGLDGLIEGFLPGDPAFAIAPVVVVVAVVIALLAVGPLVPRWGLALLGPLGVALIAYALATTPAGGDGAVLYALPVLWTTLFFGRAGAIAIVGCVAVGHAVALFSLPSAVVYPGRWVDVMVAVCAMAVVVLALERGNERLLDRLAGEARMDALTGLLNRRGFYERASLELAHARRDGKSVALATFDIDYFKRVNDEWGHEVGDQILARIGALLASESRDVDAAARLGGEEFVVLLPDNDLAGANAFIERVRLALAARDESGLPAVRVSAGILAATTPSDIQTMLQRADSALYAAKRAGRDQTVAYPMHHNPPDETPNRPLINR